jgi:quercetin dioxygenase-like cupin family protein
LTILEPYRQFSDSRGQMLGVINDGKWEEINYIETAAGCVRGGHYHRNTRELFLIISGTIKVRIRPVNGRKIKEHTFYGGDIFVIEPGEVHWFETISNCSWINVLSKRFSASAPDLVPVPAQIAA